jgi:hypothetical protein
MHFLLSTLLPLTLELFDLAAAGPSPETQKIIAAKVRLALPLAWPWSGTSSAQSRQLRESIAEARKLIDGLNGKELSLKDQEFLLKKLDEEMEKRKLNTD